MTHSLARTKHLLVFFVLFAAQAAHAQIPPPPRMITVIGTAKEQVVPDQAILSMSLVSKNLELSAAKRENDQMVEKIVAIARDFKIAKEKLSTSSISISQEYTYETVNQKNKRVFIGYVVSRMVQITMTDISIHERVLSAVVDAKVDQVNGVQLTLADPDKLTKSVRVKAIENAKQTAEALATAAGAKLGPVLNIDGANQSNDRYARSSSMMMKSMASSSAEGGSDSAVPSFPGTIMLSESVTVSFALE
jgi:uncharacterized protein YggE